MDITNFSRRIMPPPHPPFVQSHDMKPPFQKLSITTPPPTPPPPTPPPPTFPHPHPPPQARPPQPETKHWIRTWWASLNRYMPPSTRNAYATHRRSYLAFCQVIGTHLSLHRLPLCAAMQLSWPARCNITAWNNTSILQGSCIPNMASLIRWRATTISNAQCVA